MSLAYWISSHGFGHAARATAVIRALLDRDPELRIAVFGGTPRWFFEQSLGPRFEERCTFEARTTDVGLVQATALAEDMDASIAELATFLPLRPTIIESAAEATAASGARLVVADISPLGLAAARHLGLPSVLVENFTWDFIYRGYHEPRLDPFADAVAPLFDGADLRLRTVPLCPRPAETSSRPQEILETSPVSRRPRRDRAAIRAELGIGDADELVMVTMGGVPWAWRDLDRHLERHFTAEHGERRRWLLIAGGCADDTPGGMERRGPVILLAHRSPLYHPDLVHAADAVVAKLGYSTLAEVATAGVRFAYVPRPRFPESPPLEAWAREHLASLRLAPEELETGTWLTHLDALFALPPKPALVNGDDEVAGRILGLLGSSAA